MTQRFERKIEAMYNELFRKSLKELAMTEEDVADYIEDHNIGDMLAKIAATTAYDYGDDDLDNWIQTKLSSIVEDGPKKGGLSR